MRGCSVVLSVTKPRGVYNLNKHSKKLLISSRHIRPACDLITPEALGGSSYSWVASITRADKTEPRCLHHTKFLVEWDLEDPSGQKVCEEGQGEGSVGRGGKGLIEQRCREVIEKAAVGGGLILEYTGIPEEYPTRGYN